MVNDLLKHYGKSKIENLWIGKTVVNSLIQGALAALSKGNSATELSEFSKFKQENLGKWNGEMYHAFMVFKLSDGSWHLMEKNQQIAVQSNFFPKGATIADAEKVFAAKKLRMKRVDDKHLQGETLKTIMRELEMRALCLYYYTAWEFNCQYFVHSFLEAAVDIEKVVNVYDGFYYQPVMKEYFSDGKHGLLASAVSSVLTDVAAVTERKFARFKQRVDGFLKWAGFESKARAEMDDYYYYHDDDDEDGMDWKEYMFLQGYLAGIEDGKQ